jgi:hypothetical protein
VGESASNIVDAATIIPSTEKGLRAATQPVRRAYARPSAHRSQTQRRGLGRATLAGRP